MPSAYGDAMKRRSRAGGEPIKGRRRKAPEPKRGNAPKAPAGFKPSPANEETAVARLTHDLREALEQQTATSEVLRVISSYPGDPQPVFQAMLKNAVRLCDAKFGNIYSWDGDALHLVATENAPTAFAEARRRASFRPSPKTPTGRMIANKKVVHIADLRAEKAYVDRDPWIVAGVELASVRTVLMVPMLKENELIGAFSVYRQEVRPFTDKQITLVSNFAAQAVIAIENARLLNELRQRTTDLTERTADLTEALEQQTATSEVLQVISSFAGELDPVFQAILANATRICEAEHGALFLFSDGTFQPVAAHGASAALPFERLRVEPAPGTGLGRMVSAKAAIQIADVLTDEDFPRDHPLRSAAERRGVRTLLCVPMIKEGELIGAISFFRQEVRPFTDKQIELVKNFAAQAVIAIENARLLNELRQRTTDLTEALEQQTATAEVLQVISSSPGDLQPVFASMLENAVRICDATFGNIYRWDGEALHLLAAENTPSAFAEARKRLPRHPSPNTPAGRTIVTRTAVHVADLAAEQAYGEHHDPATVEAVELGGVRTFISVPLLKENELLGTFSLARVADAAAEPGYVEQHDPAAVAAVELGGQRTALYAPMLKESELIGAFTLSRQDVRPFTDKQIELVQNFAAQAVIAIENARLLNELRDRTEEVEKLNKHLEQRVADQVGEIERMSRLRRFLPPQVADLIVASGSEKQLESHRREITALFCDLRGFTGFTESADAEDVMALLRDYHAAIGELVIRYSGTLERYAGDGVMVVFNDPVPVENPALQAVLMALELRHALGALTATWSRLGHEIGFGIGIAHGFATLGTIGYEGRFDYAAIGTVSNVASRLCDEAKPGQILISARVLTKVENTVKVEPVGEFELKGIRRPLAAYNVVAAQSSLT